MPADERDARHIRKMVRRAPGSAVAGRGLLMLGWGPVSWVVGVIALAHAKILEHMEIGHNVMHGQYDWMNDPEPSSKSYDWDIVCAREHWINSRNVKHHNHANILETVWLRTETHRRSRLADAFARHAQSAVTAA